MIATHALSQVTLCEKVIIAPLLQNDSSSPSESTHCYEAPFSCSLKALFAFISFPIHVTEKGEESTTLTSTERKRCVIPNATLSSAVMLPIYAGNRQDDGLHKKRKWEQT